MNYEEKYNQALERATFYNNELPTKEQRKMLVDIFPELKESEDERIRKGIIRNLQYLMDRSEGFVKEDLQERIAWLEKQGEKEANQCSNCINDKGCVTCEHGELRETTTRTLNADKVIEWIDEHVHTKFEEMQNYVNQFKKDFGL